MQNIQLPVRSTDRAGRVSYSSHSARECINGVNIDHTAPGSVQATTIAARSDTAFKDANYASSCFVERKDQGMSDSRRMPPVDTVVVRVRLIEYPIFPA